MKKKMGNENSWPISKRTKQNDGNDFNEDNDNDGLFKVWKS